MIRWLQSYGKWLLLIVHVLALLYLIAFDFQALFPLVFTGLLLVSLWLIWFSHFHKNPLATTAVVLSVLGWGGQLAWNHFSDFQMPENFNKLWGFTLGGTPLVFGVFYFLLAYASAALSNQLFISKAFRYGAAVLIQVVALISWYSVGWKLGLIPGENASPTMGYWLISIFLATLFQGFISFRFVGMNNPIARMFLMVQVGFFLLVNLLV